MGFDYALVHLFYTIPPAIALTLLYRPFLTRLDVYKILFLIIIAVVATTPWDSYLIHNRVWTYPTNAIIGPTLFSIPAEEIFFFVIQTYNTSLLYLIFSTPTFHPVYLCGESVNGGRALRKWRWLGQAILIVGILSGVNLVAKKGEGFYLGLILVWAGPFVLLLWTLAYQFLLGLPWTNTILPITAPTLYLWIVDTLALKRGTWVIESGTKLGWHLWDGLEIEEAVFFLATNLLIVFGLVAFDNALAILQTFALMFPNVPTLPSPVMLVQGLLIPIAQYDEQRIEGLKEALERLRRKSRSFYLASGVFQGRLRIDLVLLYSFCRVADDLVDNAGSVHEAKHWISQLNQYLDYAYFKDNKQDSCSMEGFVKATFPPSAQAALILLPTSYLSSQPLYDLLKGFEMDLDFSSGENSFPIADESSLQKYASRVAGTVAEACIELVYHHTSTLTDKAERRNIVHAGGQMGIALQYVNIARDIKVDAQISRVYLPTTWLKERGLVPEDIVGAPDTPDTNVLRQKLLDQAMEIYFQARAAIELLPVEARGPMRVAVESYMEIGRVLRKPGYRVKAGRATVSKLRRLEVAWNALSR
ncbi:hypothetical protein MMC26_005247 [Xylographa opegraphella]|nr:hypothetical protein [Xylographa opegraphella]